VDLNPALHFELDAAAAADLSAQLDAATVHYRTDHRSHLGGVMETVAFWVSLTANAVTIAAIFMGRNKNSRPENVVVILPTQTVVLKPEVDEDYLSLETTVRRIVETEAASKPATLDSAEVEDKKL